MGERGVMVQRCTYRRRKSFRTASNAVRKVKTPGGELVLHYMGKKGNGPKCGDCKKKLHGIPALRPCEYKRISIGRKMYHVHTEARAVPTAFASASCGRSSSRSR